MTTEVSPELIREINEAVAEKPVEKPEAPDGLCSIMVKGHRCLQPTVCTLNVMCDTCFTRGTQRYCAEHRDKMVRGEVIGHTACSVVPKGNVHLDPLRTDKPAEPRKRWWQR